MRRAGQCIVPNRLYAGGAPRAAGGPVPDRSAAGRLASQIHRALPGAKGGNGQILPPQDTAAGHWGQGVPGGGITVQHNMPSTGACAGFL